MHYSKTETITESPRTKYDSSHFSRAVHPLSICAHYSYNIDTCTQVQVLTVCRSPGTIVKGFLVMTSPAGL